MLDVHDCVEKDFIVGGQYGRPESSGAFTGDVSMELLAQHGCRYVLCGHCEHRYRYHESDADVGKQAEAAIAAGLEPIVCIGESADERVQGETDAVLTRQVQSIPCHSTIAYEPIWAIGKGKTPTVEEIKHCLSLIRSLLPEHEKGETRILYGGSVTAENAGTFLEGSDADGFLIGGSSLDPAVFQKIIDSLPI